MHTDQFTSISDGKTKQFRTVFLPTAITITVNTLHNYCPTKRSQGASA